MIPERFCKKDPTISYSDLRIGDIVTGTLKMYNHTTQTAYIDFGNDVFGELFLSNFSANIFSNTETAERHLFYKMKKQIVSEVIDILDGIPLLSRKIVQIKTMEKLRNSIGTIVNASVEKVYRYGAFIDVGSGIEVLLKPRDFSVNRYSDMTNLLVEGDNIEVMITDFNIDSKQFEVSRKKCFSNSTSCLRIGEIYDVIPSTPIRDIFGDITGYFVEYNPQLNGIMDVFNGLVLNEGVPVKAYLKKITEKGLKFGFRF